VTLDSRASFVRRVLWLGTLIAGVATVGSLWFSLGLGLVPCTLCWYQRILMYPLVVVLGVAAIDGRPDVWRSVLPLSIVGVVIAGYHSWLQATTVSCQVEGSCAAVQWQSPVLGLSIPNLSLIGFLLLTAVALLARNAVSSASNR
jgi:disulfide bond formation protein DsbB